MRAVTGRTKHSTPKEVAVNSYVPNTLVLLALTLALVAAPARAQGLASGAMSVKVPFSFTAGGKTMPAGTYRIQRAAQAGGCYVLQSEDGEAAAVLTHAVRGEQQASHGGLVFRSYGGEYFLAQVWMPGSRTGNALSPSEAEERLADQGSEPELVSVRTIAR
jgi:hypothetical protein